MPRRAPATFEVRSAQEGMHWCRRRAAGAQLSGKQEYVMGVCACKNDKLRRRPQMMGSGLEWAGSGMGRSPFAEHFV